MTKSFVQNSLGVVSGLLTLWAAQGYAQDDEGLSLDQAASDPTASLMSFRLQDFYTLKYHNLDDEDGMPDVNLSTLQPIFNLSLGDGWSAGLSEMTFVYDWKQGAFTSVPLGIKVSKLVKFGTTPEQFQLSYEHNPHDEGVAPEDTVGLTVKQLLPAG